MPALRVLAAPARTLSFLLAPEGARYTLPAPVCRAPRTDDGALVAEGESATAPRFIVDLEPQRTYRLETDLGRLVPHTLPCAGLIDATDHDVSASRGDNARAFRDAIAAVPAGGTLRPRPGCYLSGPVFLKSGMTLLLDEGAELAAVGDRTSWPQLAGHDQSGRMLGTWEGLPKPASPLSLPPSTPSIAAIPTARRTGCRTALPPLSTTPPPWSGA